MNIESTEHKINCTREEIAKINLDSSSKKPIYAIAKIIYQYLCNSGSVFFSVRNPLFLSKLNLVIFIADSQQLLHISKSKHPDFDMFLSFLESFFNLKLSSKELSFLGKLVRARCRQNTIDRKKFRWCKRARKDWAGSLITNFRTSNGEYLNLSVNSVGTYSKDLMPASICPSIAKAFKYSSEADIKKLDKSLVKSFSEKLPCSVSDRKIVTEWIMSFPLSPFSYSSPILHFVGEHSELMARMLNMFVYGKEVTISSDKQAGELVP